MRPFARRRAVNTFSRSGTSLLALAVGLTVAGLTWVGWTRALGPTQPRAAGQHLLLPCSEEVKVQQQRIRAKAEVVDRVLARELSLAEAAAWFRFFNDNPPECRDDFRRCIPGRSDGEKACRQVIGWARARLNCRLPDSPTAAAVARLEDELTALLTEGEVVQLPW
jgi:hypothetical protein